MSFLGSSGGFSHDDDSILSEINITPLVDDVRTVSDFFVALPFLFAVTAPP